MRLLVISDSHRNVGAVDKILSAETEARHVFFLGDVTSDIESIKDIYPERIFHIVSGNCDFISDYPCSDTVSIGGHGVFFTHGHLYGVKGGTSAIIDRAKRLSCDIALFGHTHIACQTYDDGIYIVNPGSCSRSRSGPNSYAVIDIVSGGVMPIIKKL